MGVGAGAKVDATCDLTRVMIGYRRLRPGVAEGPAVFWSGEAVRWQRPPRLPIGANFWLSSDFSAGLVRCSESAISNYRRLFSHIIDVTMFADRNVMAF
jgi:hypothetical protein